MFASLKTVLASRRLTGRTRAARVVVLLALAGGGALVPFGSAHAVTSCISQPNPVACENALPGTPESVWEVGGAGDLSIQGFATQISVNAGQTIDFKIKTDATQYRIDIYRLGYYQGNGARFITSIQPSATLPQTQPACNTDPTTQLLDCGNWGVSASWAVPADSVSGVYIARLVRGDTNGASHILFVVRNDARNSDILFQTSDETWEAYNAYGGIALYDDESAGSRAFKVSYNRPLTLRDYAPYSNFFYGEYPMVRFLERNGYDVSYFTGVDTATRGGLILNHKVFMSTGHDEYWSGDQRANVERARDAGVNLAFFSGNEMFWKTRWEPSIDGSSTPNRTLVTYKETYTGKKTDPSPQWTGTWRDPRQSPPSDGGRPENAVTGTLFMMDSFRNDAIKVPAADGKYRFWRNTMVAGLAQGAVATLSQGTLGYEWDVDADNGFRPPGEIDLSSTAVSTSSTYLLDYGTTYGAGTATHSLTLYRAPSGALVFGAGTVQWSWGLDGDHDYWTSKQTDDTSTDPSIQQATVNLFADMGAQPATLMATLAPASKSTDTTPPSITITGPSDGAQVARGAPVTITGTARDTGGGVVAGVEVSTDGGATWHPAQGRENWSYTWPATGVGPAQIEARATDDSVNTGPAASIGVTVGGCPCSVWSDGVTPTTTSTAVDPSANELGMKFQSDVDGYITALRFYKGSLNTGMHVGHLWTRDGTLLATAQFRNESATGWQQVMLAHPVAVTANTTYVVSYYAPNGGYAIDRPALQNTVADPPLRALGTGVDGPDGVFKSGASGFPTQSTPTATNYWVDVVFSTDGTDRTPPSVLSVTPAAGSTSVSVTAPIVAQFDEALDPAHVTTASVQLIGPGGSAAPATVAFDPTTNQVSLTPTSPLALATKYTLVIHGGSGGVTDAAGNPLAADYTETLTTFDPASCPCSIWSSSTTPSTTSYSDSGAYELGLKFRADVSGYVTGVRFYKGAGNTGTHVGHLWSSSGTLLATAAFKNETASGWQQATFAAPIAISAGTTYIISYWDPNGHYALDRPAFATSGYDSGILHALKDGLDGGNGVFASGSTAFPTKTNQSSNYWVDVVYSTDGTDRQPPSVLSTKPAAGASSISVAAPLQAQFDEPLKASTVNGQTVQLIGPSGPAPATVTYDSTSSTVTLTPTATLATASKYSLVIHGGATGVTDLAGNPLPADFTANYTTFDPASCPCSIWSASTTPSTTSYGDNTSYELGMKFRSDIAGYITGIRFYKGSGNTGTHIGHLWSAGGTMLAQVTFTNETATGWQQANFGVPVAISPNTTYVISYWDPAGRYALDRPYFTSTIDNGVLHALKDGLDGGNGVFRNGSSGFPSQSTSTPSASNYWVDPVFSTDGTDRQGPRVFSTSPTAGATGVSISSPLEVQFDEPLDPSTVTAQNVQLTSGGAPVAATVSYDASTNKIRVVPTANLAFGTAYMLTVHGGAGGVADPAGNPIVADVTLGFTTWAPSCPCTIWPSTKVPATTSFWDTGSYELGMKFRSDVDGYVTGVRFYKGVDNTGTHVGHLWTSTGTMLGQVTFTNETASGWQQANFAAPIPIKANTTYVVSYWDPAGHYALDRPGFATSVDNGILHGLKDGFDGGNGVFVSQASGFPTKSNQASNYWVDVVFSLTAG